MEIEVGGDSALANGMPVIFRIVPTEKSEGTLPQFSVDCTSHIGCPSMSPRNRYGIADGGFIEGRSLS